MPPVVFVVPHTHWDREWYHPAARFEARLARLVDAAAAALAADPDVPTFLLDGQGVVLDDYARHREGGAATLKRLLADGRLEAGPWYVLPDEFLVSAESLVRNLFEGARAVRRYGGRPLSAGYAPDAFGHTGALPTLLAGFGIGTAVVWRGFGGAPGQEQDLYRWRGPDGASVVMVHLPPDGYENGANLPVEAAAAAERWAVLRAQLAPRARAPVWLVLNGADHHALQPHLALAVASLRAAADGADVRLAGLGDYAEAVGAWARAHPASLPAVSGELREGWAYAWVLQGTHGSRLYLKQANGWCQRFLERVVEPLAALALARGVDLREDVRVTWRTLLENHPHDSICGTSHDGVHRDMQVRFARCAALADEAARRALDVLTARDAAAARVAARTAWRPALVVMNPGAVAFSGVMEARVALFRGDVQVGQAWVRRGTGAQGHRGTEGAETGIVVSDPEGRGLPYQELERWEGHDLVESPLHYPDADAVEWRRLAIQVGRLSPLSVSVWSVEETAAVPPADIADPVRWTGDAIDNGRVRVRVAADGTFTLTDVASGRSASGLGGLEDERDLGDSYTSSVPLDDVAVQVPDGVAVRVAHEGPLRAEIETVRRYEAAELAVTTRLTLDAGAGHVAIAVSGVNRRRDHRLRMVFPLGERPRRCVADGHFGPVERQVGVPRAPAGARERPAPTAPMQRYVVAAGARTALAVFGDGLPQYELRRNGTLLLTVLRAFGGLSKPNLPERLGHAGWPTPTPEAQCLGPFTARCAVWIGGAGAADDLAGVERVAEAFLAPPWALMQRALLAPPAPVEGPTLEGDGLVISAMKPAEEGRAIVLRCYNARAEVVQGAWRLPWPVTSAERCRLDETPVGPLPVTAGATIRFGAGPREVVTIRVV